MGKEQRNGSTGEWKEVLRLKRKVTTVEEMLSKIPVFETLKSRELRQVAGIVHRRQYIDGEYVCLQGDPGLGMYLIEQGEVSVVLSGDNGVKKEIAVLKEGDFFGELSLLDSETRSASATAHTDCFLFKIDQEPFYELMETRPEVGKGFIKILCQRLRAQNEKAVALKR